MVRFENVSETENFFVKARRRSIQKAKNLIASYGKKGVKHSEIVALIKMDGASEKTALDYLNTLQDAGFLRYDPKEKPKGRWFIIAADEG